MSTKTQGKCIAAALQGNLKLPSHCSFKGQTYLLARKLLENSIYQTNGNFTDVLKPNRREGRHFLMFMPSMGWDWKHTLSYPFCTGQRKQPLPVPSMQYHQLPPLAGTGLWSKGKQGQESQIFLQFSLPEWNITWWIVIDLISCPFFQMSYIIDLCRDT